MNISVTRSTSPTSQSPIKKGDVSKVYISTKYTCILIRNEKINFSIYLFKKRKKNPQCKILHLHLSQNDLIWLKRI